MNHIQISTLKHQCCTRNDHAPEQRGVGPRKSWSVNAHLQIGLSRYDQISTCLQFTRLINRQGYLAPVNRSIMLYFLYLKIRKTFAINHCAIVGLNNRNVLITIASGFQILLNKLFSLLKIFFFQIKTGSLRLTS